MEIISQMYVHLLTHPERGQRYSQIQQDAKSVFKHEKVLSRGYKNLFKHLHEMIFTKE